MLTFNVLGEQGETGMARWSTTFKLGISGNPGRRPKVIGEVRDLARLYTLEASEPPNSILSDKRTPAAAQAILDPQLMTILSDKPLSENEWQRQYCS